MSRSKGNQAMQFDQLIKYNMRDIFLEKSNIKCIGEDICIPFSERACLWINSLKLKQFVFVVCKVKDYRNTWKLSCRPYAFISYKAPL